MLSDRQKSVLFKTRIVSKPRYVRVPLQMYNGVRELKTDVYFPRLLQQYQQNIELMQRLLPDERICHLRADVHGIKDWQRTYERFTCAFRSLNASDHPPHAHYRLPYRRHRGRRKTLRDAVGYLRLRRRFRLRRPRFAAAVLLPHPPAHSAWLHLIYRSARGLCFFKNR